MTRYEYKVVPAPVQGRKARGVKGTAGRFAHALETLMNELGAEGWEYVRADTLPCEERTGLTGRTTTYQNMLVFRRLLRAVEDEPAPAISGLLAAPLPDEGGEARPETRPEMRPETRPDMRAPLAATGAEAGHHREPPLTRGARHENDGVTDGATGQPGDTSEAARAAAAALRSYRAGSPRGASEDDDDGAGGRGGLAAE
jgi:hypothetical protein